MKNKCEICGSSKNLRETFCKPVEFIGTVFSATLCADCEKKYSVNYFHYYYAVDSLAENLVREYRERNKKKEATMQVTYNGFTGELVKLEKYSTIVGEGTGPIPTYELCIYDSKRQCVLKFRGVKLEDVKFLGEAVTFV